MKYDFGHVLLSRILVTKKSPILWIRIHNTALNCGNDTYDLLFRYSGHFASQPLPRPVGRQPLRGGRVAADDLPALPYVRTFLLNLNSGVYKVPYSKVSIKSCWERISSCEGNIEQCHRPYICYQGC